MGILKIIREKWFIAFCMLMVCLFSLVFPQTAQASTTYDVILAVEQVFTKPEGSQAADVFTYTLTALEHGNPMPADSSGDICTFAISGTDTINLGTITYNTTGTYSYEIKQKVETEQTGYTYDMQVYTLRVYVKNTDEGLKAEVIGIKENGYKAASIEFANAYAPISSDPSAMVDPPVKKTVSGSPSKDGTFTFKLDAENKSYPMPTDSTEGIKLVTIVGSGEEDFGTWSYAEAGTYCYTVSEVDSGEDGYIYDTTIYTITDIVTDANGQLEVSRTITNEANEAVDAYEFVNQYTSDAGGSSFGSTKGVKTGDNVNIEFYQVMIVVAGVVLIVYVVYRIKNRKNRA